MDAFKTRNKNLEALIQETQVKQGKDKRRSAAFLSGCTPAHTTIKYKGAHLLSFTHHNNSSIKVQLIG